MDSEPLTVDIVARIEQQLDALEAHGIAASDFAEKCRALESLLEAHHTQLLTLKDRGDDSSARLQAVISRIAVLETRAARRAEMPSQFQKYIADNDI
jgi:hypothetical protein